MNTDAEKRYKRAHWRASRALIERHRPEFERLLAAEMAVQVDVDVNRDAFAEIAAAWFDR